MPCQQYLSRKGYVSLVAKSAAVRNLNLLSAAPLSSGASLEQSSTVSKSPGFLKKMLNIRNFLRAQQKYVSFSRIYFCIGNADM
jgi:hypothetical protein